MRGALLAALVAVAVAAAPVAGDVVERRGAEPPLTGSITGVSDAGVSVTTDDGAELLVPWDRVRRVESARPLPGLERLLETAEALWRARSRLERGDTALAEPLLERLFYETYRGRTSVTARLVADGLARCRIAHGAPERAVIPMLEATRLARAGIGPDPWPTLPPLVEPDLALCSRLAPAWVRSRRLAELEADLAAWDAGGDRVLADLAALYRLAARRALGLEADAPALREPGHPGVGLLALVVESAAPDAARRASARRGLEERLDALAPWAQGWAHFALGTSLLRETGAEDGQRGLVHLVHLPARFRTTLPYLSGLALAAAAEASRDRGDTAAAAVFEAQLRRWLPGHPVLDATPPLVTRVRPEEHS